MYHGRREWEKKVGGESRKRKWKERKERKQGDREREQGRRRSRERLLGGVGIGMC